MPVPKHISNRGKIKGWRTIRYPDGTYRKIAITEKAGPKGGHTFAFSIHEPKEPGVAEKKFIQGAIKHPGALTSDVGGKPSENLARVRHLAKHGTTAQKRRANFYLKVLRPAARSR